MAHSFRRFFSLRPKSTLSPQDKRRLWDQLSARTQAVQGTGAPPSPGDVVDYLLKTGIDYAGQVNAAFQVSGWSGLLGARIDVLRIALAAVGFPFLPLTGAVRPELTLKGARQRLILVAHQGEQPGYPNPMPVCLAELQGVTGGLRLQLGVEAGPSWNPTKDVPGLEEAGIRFSVRATAGLGGGYEGTWLRLWDARPGYYARAERSTRLARDAAARLSGGPVPTAGAGGAGPAGFNPLCSFTMWTQAAEASASLDAELRAKVGIGQTVGAELKPSVKGPRLQRNWSWTSYRLQTIAANGVVTTQDAELTYKKTSGQLLQLDAELRATAGSQPAYASKPFKDLFGLKKKTEHTFVNALAYRAGVLCWHHADRRLRPLRGSGVQLGHSVTLPSLVALLDGSLDDQRRYDFVVALAGAVGVEPERLWAFLVDGADLIWSLVRDPGARPDALLVEADFQATHQSLREIGKTVVERDQPPAFLALLERERRGLEAIRLRYRMRDVANNDRTRFKLGVYPYASEAYVQVDRLDQLGSEGIVDLHVTAFAAQSVAPAILLA